MLCIRRQPKEAKVQQLGVKDNPRLKSLISGQFAPSRLLPFEIMGLFLRQRESFVSWTEEHYLFCLLQMELHNQMQIPWGP